MTNLYSQPTLGQGIYTLPDAALILGLPTVKLRRWLQGINRKKCGKNAQSFGIVEGGYWGDGRDTGMNFYAMIELYVLGQLREHGMSMQKIRKAHTELKRYFQTNYPFATAELLTQDGHLYTVLNDAQLLELDAQGQSAFNKILNPFCKKIEFDQQAGFATSFWPLGKEYKIVVDPAHAFGQPRIDGTNILAEVIADLVSAGESPEYVAKLYNIEPEDVNDCMRYMHPEAA
jgi:uncharacterized protein (DUF433 family)